MTLIVLDNIIKDPESYVSKIHTYGFQDIADGDKVFKNIQPRVGVDEFADFVLHMFPDFKVAFNFIRKSSLNQEEPNFIHSDEMMGDMTCILYLNENAPKDDGTTIYDADSESMVTVYSKFNRMIVFPSAALHSRNIYENFGEGEKSRLIQVIFLKRRR